MYLNLRCITLKQTANEIIACSICRVSKSSQPNKQRRSPPSRRDSTSRRSYKSRRQRSDDCLSTISRQQQRQKAVDERGEEEESTSHSCDSGDELMMTTTTIKSAMRVKAHDLSSDISSLSPAMIPPQGVAAWFVFSYLMIVILQRQVQLSARGHSRDTTTSRNSRRAFLISPQGMMSRCPISRQNIRNGSCMDA
jgi:hypothetical protein